MSGGKGLAQNKKDLHSVCKAFANRNSRGGLGRGAMVEIKDERQARPTFRLNLGLKFYAQRRRLLAQTT